MIVFPNAKINLGLNITEKRSDGFHNIETIFYPIRLSDILEISNSNDTLTFENTGLVVENKSLESNLCYKAYQLLQNDFSINPVHIHLHKIIPFGAGIGGGSSDASFSLKLLNELNELNLSNKQLTEYAEKIGSDCPFFIFNKPAYAEGKGEILNPIELTLSGYHLVLIHPGIHINTAFAYSQVTPKKPSISLDKLIKQPISEWKNLIQNDFEPSVFKQNPELKEIKEDLYKAGAQYASMSGSGSAIYGLFKAKPDLKGKFEKYFIWTEILK